MLHDFFTFLFDELVDDSNFENNTVNASFSGLFVVLTDPIGQPSPL